MLHALRTLLVGGILLISTPGAQAQAGAVRTEVFGLRPSTGSRQQTIGLGDSKSRAIQVLGKPTKTSRFYFEIDKGWATVLHYGSNQLFFFADRLVLAELHDASLTVGKVGTPGFRVGSALPKTKLKAAKPPLAFGNFTVEQKSGTSRNLPYSAISYGNMKTAKGQVLDVAYEILYDRRGRVTHIFLDETYD